MYKPFIPVKDLRAAYYMEDFMGASLYGMNWLTRSVGTPIVSMEYEDAGGVVLIAPGSTADNYVELYQPFQVLSTSKGIYFSARVYIDAFPANTVIYIGTVALTPNNESDRIGFIVWRATGPMPNWSCTSTSVGSQTIYTSGVAAGGWQELSFAASTDAISFWINDSYVGTHTTNIPIVDLGSSAKIETVTGVVAARYLLIDYIEAYSDRV